MQGCRLLAITEATADSLGTPLLLQRVQGGLTATQGPIPSRKVLMDATPPPHTRPPLSYVSSPFPPG